MSVFSAMSHSQLVAHHPDAPNRPHLYPIFDAGHAVWSDFATRITRPDRYVRLVNSHNIRGDDTIVTIPDWIDPRVDRIANPTKFIDFLLLDPVRYFLTHDRCTGIWIKYTDRDDFTDTSTGFDYTTIHTADGSSVDRDADDGSDDDNDDELDSNGNGSVAARVDVNGDDIPLRACLYLRRTDLDHSTAIQYRFMQELCFIGHGVGFPPAADILDTIHGR